MYTENSQKQTIKSNINTPTQYVNKRFNHSILFAWLTLGIIFGMIVVMSLIQSQQIGEIDYSKRTPLSSQNKYAMKAFANNGLTTEEGEQLILYIDSETKKHLSLDQDRIIKIDELRSFENWYLGTSIIQPEKDKDFPEAIRFLLTKDKEEIEIYFQNTIKFSQKLEEAPKELISKEQKEFLQNY